MRLAQDIVPLGWGLGRQPLAPGVPRDTQKWRWVRFGPARRDGTAPLCRPRRIARISNGFHPRSHLRPPCEVCHGLEGGFLLARAPVGPLAAIEWPTVGIWSAHVTDRCQSVHLPFRRGCSFTFCHHRREQTHLCSSDSHLLPLHGRLVRTHFKSTKRWAKFKLDLRYPLSNIFSVEHFLACWLALKRRCRRDLLVTA